MKTTTLLETARSYVAAGLSVLPIAPDGSKRPSLNTWSPYQTRQPTEAELRQWFSVSAGIAVIGGAVSGNLEVLDFDEPGIYEQFAELAEDNGFGDLIGRLPLAETPSGCRHLYYRCAGQVKGNTPLARIEDEATEDTPGARLRDGLYWKLRTRIETRGEGGYAVVPPTPAICHPDNRPYVMLRGDLTGLPVVTDEERTALHRLAAVFNKYLPPEFHSEKPKDTARPASEGLTPGDDFNTHGDVLELLQRHGAQVTGCRGETVLIKRPGKSERGHSATWNHGGHRFLTVFSSSWYPFEPERHYSPFAIYTLLEHAGDFSASAKTLYAAGYGDRKESKCGTLESFAIPQELQEAAGQTLTLDAWKKRGRRLADWRRACDDEFRWRAGDWYNLAISGVPYGEKEAFARSVFGEGLYHQVRKAASVCAAFPPDKRDRNIPFWVHVELAGQQEETRAHWMQKFKAGGLTREALRTEIGAMPQKREPKGWLAVRQLLPVSLANELVSAIVKEGSSVVIAKVRAALGIGATFEAAPPAEEEETLWAGWEEPEMDAVSGHESVPEMDAKTGDSLLKTDENWETNFSAGGKIGEDVSGYRDSSNADSNTEFLPMAEDEPMPSVAVVRDTRASETGHWAEHPPATDDELRPLKEALSSGTLQGRNLYLRGFGKCPFDKAVLERFDLLRRAAEGDQSAMSSEVMSRKCLTECLRQWRLLAPVEGVTCDV